MTVHSPWLINLSNHGGCSKDLELRFELQDRTSHLSDFGTCMLDEYFLNERRKRKV